MKQQLTTALTMLAFPVLAQDIDTGRQLFADHCATCHGLEARGNGPMSEVLSVPPNDLTKLASEHDGSFPIGDVLAKIDGRKPVWAHGGDMPIFGFYFEGKGVFIRNEHGAPIMTSQPIIDIVHWLQTVQQ